jgi:hypothetical protein
MQCFWIVWYLAWFIVDSRFLPNPCHALLAGLAFPIDPRHRPLHLVSEAALHESDDVEALRLASPEQDRHQIGVLANFPPFSDQRPRFPITDAIACQQIYPEVKHLLGRIEFLSALLTIGRLLVGLRPSRSEGFFNLGVGVGVGASLRHRSGISRGIVCFFIFQSLNFSLV